MIAAEKGHLEVCQLLVHLGADANLLNKVSELLRFLLNQVNDIFFFLL